MPDPVRNLIADLQEELVETRRHLHMHPELGFEEHQTSRFVSDRLRALGLQPLEGVGKTGVVCLIEGSGEGKTIALRADMDALPIEEQNDFEYKSRHPGKMHACGHDGHTTMLLGAAAVLRQMRTRFRGRVKLVFQPSEESVSGAEAMIADGVLENPKVDAALALHGWPGIPLGKIGLRSGAIMASSDSFDIHVFGKGGHAAYPQACVDPIYVATQIVSALQGLVSRESGPDNPAVITITKVQAGTAYNVIPEVATLSGTFRTLSETKRTQIRRRIEEVAEAVARGFGAKAELTFYTGCPVTVNDPRMATLVEQAVTEALGPNAVEPVLHPSMGAEDFAFFCQKTPAMMFHLGLGDRPFCHNPKFDFDDRALPLGIEVFVKSAIKYLNETAPDGPHAHH